MPLEALIIWLVIGAIAGWLAGQIMTGGGFGLIGDIIVGIIGAVIAGWLFPQVSVSSSEADRGRQIIHALVGAIIVLFVVRLVVRR